MDRRGAISKAESKTRIVPGCADFVILPKSVDFWEMIRNFCVETSRTIRNTLSVYILFPDSSRVYIRCMAVTEELGASRCGQHTASGT